MHYVTPAVTLFDLVVGLVSAAVQPVLSMTHAPETVLPHFA